jgi:hypothetical protein
VVLRFTRDGDTMMILDAEGSVRVAGEVVARFADGELRDAGGAVVARMEAEGPLRDGDGAELPFVVLRDGALRIEGQTEGATITADGELRYAALGGDMNVRIAGLDAENRRTAMLLVLFQSGFLTPRFREGVLRAKAREAEQNLGVILEAAAQWVRAGRQVPAIGPIPAEPHCDEQPWPGDAGFAALGFAPERARFSYALRREGDELVVTARADLDCDQVTSEYTRRARIEGRELVIGEITSESPLE